MMLPLNDIFKKYDISPNGVLHLGASEGQERDFYLELNVKKVIWIEAIKEVFDKLKYNIRSYPNQVAIFACVSNQDGKEVVFNISNNQAQSSSFLELGLHKIIHPEVHYIDKVKMNTTRIDTLFDVLDIDISMLDFLNIDLQGAELLALEGMGKLLKQFKSVNIEVNIAETYIGCPLIEDIDYFFLKRDLIRVETSDFVGNCWGDAFYLKRDLL
jgi:FkbM family methyltransferase